MSYKNYEVLKTELLDNGILKVSLNRPDSVNSVNRKMIEELLDLWAGLIHDMAVRVVILSGEGDKGFCSGFEVGDVFQADKLKAPLMYDYAYNFGELELAMRKAPQPIICALHGPAIGAGFSFALASDIRVASTEARFATYFIRIGLGGADMGCSYFLPRLIGAGRAYEYMLTGRFISSEDALNLGLISRRVEKEQLMETALDIAKDIAEKDPLAVKLTKEAINTAMDAPDLQSAIHIENRNQVLMMMHNLQKGQG
ncbi:MAG TPA: enoyl-CoA hydratase/isomerase family protein [Spirochaetota bacterium]|nr:enoyl-CoA hydratase/isomerase family protein [Spirochaetota bacterium]